MIFIILIMVKIVTINKKRGVETPRLAENGIVLNEIF